MVKAAKLDGVDVSAEVCPHHFTLTSADIPGNDANYKMNPPLRTKEDVEALKQGLHDNIMDVIATDPQGEDQAAPGKCGCSDADGDADPQNPSYEPYRHP